MMSKSNQNRTLSKQNYW